MARRTELALDRETVLREALTLLNEVGLEHFSLRGLGSRLNVQAPALYWYYKNKAELLGHMSAAIYREARGAVPPCADWPSWLVAYGRILRQRLASQRDAARLCATAQPLEPTISVTAQAIAAPLTSFGLELQQGLNAIAAVTSLCIGWGSYDVNRSMHRFLDSIIDFDRSFDVALQALVTGLKLQSEVLADASSSVQPAR